MTREEAIEFIAQSVKSDVDMAKVADAIKALELEPCEDAISRQAAMDCLTEIGLTKFDLIARNKIKNLPPVTPQEPCEEAISREQAKSDYADWFGYGYEDNTYYKHLCSMTSVTSQTKTRHWNRVTDKTGHLIWECDCGWQQRFNTNFCPDCGAKMIENEEEFDNLEEMLEKLWNDTESEEKRMNIKLDKGAFEPIREHKTDAGLDLRTPEEFVIKPNDSYIIDTGVHIELPKGYYGKLESKSGLNVKHNIVCLGGTIDEPYRGSIVVKLYNVGKEEYRFNKGDKIVQLVIQPYLAPDIEYTDKLSETDRGDNGFGSTGK